MTHESVTHVWRKGGFTSKLDSVSVVTPRRFLLQRALGVWSVIGPPCHPQHGSRSSFRLACASRHSACVFVLCCAPHSCASGDSLGNHTASSGQGRREDCATCTRRVLFAQRFLSGARERPILTDAAPFNEALSEAKWSDCARQADSVDADPKRSRRFSAQPLVLLGGLVWDDGRIVTDCHGMSLVVSLERL